MVDRKAKDIRACAFQSLRCPEQLVSSAEGMPLGAEGIVAARACVESVRDLFFPAASAAFAPTSREVGPAFPLWIVARMWPITSLVSDGNVTTSVQVCLSTTGRGVATTAPEVVVLLRSPRRGAGFAFSDSRLPVACF